MCIQGKKLKESKKKDLEQKLSTLTSDERRKLYKRAAAFRRSVGKPNKVSRRYDEEEFAPAKQRRDSLDSWVLKLLEQESEESESVHSTTTTGVVEWVGTKACRVEVPGARINCALTGAIAREQQTAIAVGDEVKVDRERLLVTSVLPRRTKLSRVDPGKQPIERVIVANVDVVIITVSVKTPPLHPRLIDRYLVAIQRGGAVPLICVNKMDLLSATERATELSILDPYRQMGAEVVPCSTANFEGVVPLKTRMEGLTCAFVGHSGVGKSSLLNAIAPQLDLYTNSVSEGYGRGRHTTTASSLYDLGGGTRLIDTPGIRSFSLGSTTPEELKWYFPEFEPFVEGCRFRDCTHIHEPVCGIKAAVERGELAKARYETYARLVG